MIKYATFVQIREDMAAIFNDRDNPRAVRIAAWDVLAETQSSNYPTWYLPFRDVVQRLENEPDIHIGSYIFSWLLDWADHPETDEHKWVSAICCTMRYISCTIPLSSVHCYS